MAELQPLRDSPRRRFIACFDFAQDEASTPTPDVAPFSQIEVTLNSIAPYTETGATARLRGCRACLGNAEPASI